MTSEARAILHALCIEEQRTDRPPYLLCALFSHAYVMVGRKHFPYALFEALLAAGAVEERGADSLGKLYGLTDLGRRQTQEFRWRRVIWRIRSTGYTPRSCALCQSVIPRQTECYYPHTQGVRRLDRQRQPLPDAVHHHERVCKTCGDDRINKRVALQSQYDLAQEETMTTTETES